MADLKIAQNLSLPLDVAGQTIGLLGIRGSGKTNTAGVIAEELLDRNVPIVYIDPTDATWGLRSKYPVFIFGGSHGDIPLQETDGKVIAEFVVTERVPLILSVRHLRKGAQRRFVTDFCEELYHLKGRDEYRDPLTIFIDEAPLFVPQRVMADVARTVGAVEDLIARGRNSGFGVVLISQRPATINKDVLSQADTIITHRLTSPHDRKALKDWLEDNATIEKQNEVLASLAGMQDGEAWVWAPRLKVMKQVQIRLRRTFDSSASPKIGAKVKAPKSLAEVDLGKLQEKLAATVEKAKADDPKELRRQIAELKKHRGADQVADVGKAIKAAVAKAVAQTERICKQQLTELQKTNGELAGRLRKIEQLAHLNGEVAAILEPPHSPVHNPTRIRQQSPQPAVAKRSYESAGISRGISDTRKSSSAEQGELNGYQRSLLQVLIDRHPIPTPRAQLGALSGRSTGSSSFGPNVRSLEDAGLITTAQGGGYIATDSGLDALPGYEPAPNQGAAALQHWLHRLPAYHSKILRVVSDRYPAALSLDEISEHAGCSMTSSMFRPSVKDLVAQSFLVQTNDGYSAAEFFFE